MSYKNIHEVEKALAACSEGASANVSVSRANIVRDEYTRANYDNARPSEKLPIHDREILIASNNAYYTVGIIRNMIEALLGLK